MIWLQLPWLPVSVLIILLGIVALRELFLSRSFLPGDPERGMALFNLCVLFVSVTGMLYGVHFLYAHEQALEAEIPIYAHARYAPEREVFRDGVFSKTWIYVSLDSADSIVKHYNALSQSGTEKIIIDTSKEGSSKLMFQSVNKKNIFLTIEKEDNISVLYYSEEGEVRTVSNAGAVSR